MLKKQPWAGSPEERRLDRAEKALEKAEKRLYASPKKLYFATGDEPYVWAAEKTARWAAYDKALDEYTEAEEKFLDRWRPGWREENPMDKYITEAYEILSDFDDEGNYSEERGWIEEKGYDMTPDEFYITSTDKAAELLMSEGATEPSSWPWTPNTWYTRHGELDAHGEVESRSFFLHGFTKNEEREIYKRVAGEGR